MLRPALFALTLGSARLEKQPQIAGQVIDAVARDLPVPVAFARMNAPCSTACVWTARLAGVHSASIPRAVIAA